MARLKTYTQQHRVGAFGNKYATYVYLYFEDHYDHSKWLNFDYGNYNFSVLCDKINKESMPTE